MFCFFGSKRILSNYFAAFNNFEVIVADKKVLIVMNFAYGAVTFPNFNGLI